MKYSGLTEARFKLDQMAKEKTGGVLSAVGKTMAAPIGFAGKGLWNASKRAGGPFAPLLFGGTVIGGAALAGKSLSQTKNYNQGFNPQLQEAMVRS